MTNLIANLRERVKTNSIIRVKRSLGGPGKINVQKGQQVEPHDILGTFELSPGFSNIEIARMLGVNPNEASQYFVRKKGEHLFKGEIIAEKKALLGREKIVYAPTDGEIEDYNPNTGYLKLKYLPKQIEITAGVYGIVEEIYPDRKEIDLRTMVIEIYGSFGSGRERSGILININGSGHLTQQHQITPNRKGHILVTGALIYKESIQQAVHNGVAGIITGGLNAQDFKSLSGSINPSRRIDTDIGISVLVTEGFGPIPIGADIYKHILEYENKFVFLCGNAGKLILPVLDPDIILTLRNVAVPPVLKSPESQPEIKIIDLKLGANIRLIWPPYVGSQGKIISIDASPTTLPSGVSSYMVTVETPHKKLRVPYSNLELI